MSILPQYAKMHGVQRRLLENTWKLSNILIFPKKKIPVNLDQRNTVFNNTVQLMAETKCWNSKSRSNSIFLSLFLSFSLTYWNIRVHSHITRAPLPQDWSIDRVKTTTPQCKTSVLRVHLLFVSPPFPSLPPCHTRMQFAEGSNAIETVTNTCAVSKVF